MTILFSVLLFSLNVTEGEMKQTAIAISGCEEGAAFYCSGFADGLEAGGVAKELWNSNYNKCMVGKGCPKDVLPISQ